LATLDSLHTLDLSYCGYPKALLFGPLVPLLQNLRILALGGSNFDDLPVELCSGTPWDDVLTNVHAHYADLESGVHHDAEVSVFFLGNAGTGKTQLRRQLRGEPFDASVPTTHGIHVNEKMMELEGFPELVRLNLWDFGGQEIYHGSHALFVQGQAIFLILWTPKHEAGSYSEGDLSFLHRPLSYWLDYLRAFVGVSSSILLIQSQCDSFKDDAPAPAVTANDFPSVLHFKASALTKRGLSTLGEALKESARDCLYRRPPPPIGAGRVRVRDRLRGLLAEDQMRPATKRQHRLLERTAPVYWKYGCWFYEKTTKSQVLIDSQWDDPKTEVGRGKICFQAWGERAGELIEPLLAELQKLPVGRPPEISRSIFAGGEVRISASASATGVPSASRSEHVAHLEQLDIPARAELPVKNPPEVFVSYAWRNPFSVDLVEKLCLSLEGEWRIIRDTTGIQRGDLISVFMKCLSRADCVIVVLSNEYLRSRYCMTELYDV
jgi:hypothetical protein